MKGLVSYSLSIPTLTCPTSESNLDWVECSLHKSHLKGSDIISSIIDLFSIAFDLLLVEIVILL